MPGVNGLDELRLKGERVVLRPVRPEDVTDQYVAWMSDPEVNRFMETRFKTHGREDIAAFVESQRADANVRFFAITLKEDGRHVGNIKLAVRSGHATGEISLFIGDKAQWGRGLGSEAIALVRDYGLKVLGLAKLTAGCYAPNFGSAKAFEKAGFKREAVLKAEHLCDGKRVDGYRYAFFAQEES